MDAIFPPGKEKKSFICNYELLFQVPIDRVSSATSSTALARDHTQESVPSSKKLSIPSEPVSLKSRSLGVTTEGKLKLLTERENDNPKSKWKNECLKRGGSGVGSQSSVSSEQQFVTYYIIRSLNEKLEI